MNLIDLYVAAVMKCLPESQRESAEKILRERINSFLTENPSEKDIRTVLEQLGDPNKLAKEYRLKTPYLIGPTLYYRYLDVLKLVMIIVPAISAGITLILAVSNLEMTNSLLDYFIETFASVISSALNGAAQAFLWVTVVFIIMEKKGVCSEDLPFKQKKWSVEELLKVPTSNKARVSRIEMVFAIFFTTFFTSIIYFKSNWIGWYSFDGGESTLTIEPLFVLERLQDYLFAIILLAFLQLSIHIYKTIKGRWIFPIAIINALYNLAISILFALMAADQTLFNKGFIKKINNLTNINISLAEWHKFTGVIAIIFVIGCIIDSIVGFVKSRKKLS